MVGDGARCPCRAVLVLVTQCYCLGKSRVLVLSSQLGKCGQSSGGAGFEGVDGAGFRHGTARREGRGRAFNTTPRHV